MKKKKKSKFKIAQKIDFLKNKYFWIFVGILVLGSFLRSYNFIPWMHFELDQSRDAALVDESLHGNPTNLPLLGPRAGGSLLRLGPAFYYIEYLFSMLVNNSVEGSALASVFFSILSLLAIYFFQRRYFSKNLSLATTLIFATSIFLITYARFSWNPNLLPFFVLMFFLALLRAVDEDEKKRGYWLMFCAFLFGFISQFHFLAMVIIFITAVMMLLYKRPQIKSGFWVACVVIVLFLNLPLVINDIKSGGDNIKQLTSTVNKKSEGGGEKYDILEKTIKDYVENTLSYWTIITGSQSAELPRVTTQLRTLEIDFICNETCRRNLPEGIMAMIFFTLGIIILVMESIIEKEPRKKDFLIFNLILLVVSFGVFYFLAYDLSPRFFLIVIPLPFVFGGLIFYELARFIKIRNLVWAFAVIFAGFNLYFTVNYFNQLAKAKTEAIDIGNDKIFRQKTRITLEQQNLIIDYIEKIYRQNKYPVLYYGQSEFHRAFGYLLDGRAIPRDGIGMSDTAKICKKANYFLIIRTQSNKNTFAKYFEKFVLVEENKFGTLTVYRLSPKNTIINCEIPDQSKFREDVSDEDSVSKRYTWKEVFNIK
ncbi:MAG: glycosyltransferase family 39 protein [Parcubacteria group bacterium]|jgi:hypothetical protein